MTSTEPPAPVVLGGRYEIHRRLARGGMAEVFLARDSALDRPVAVKVLFPEYSTDPAFVERFRREAQAAANLAHPNVVGVYDWGAEDGTYYIVMEYVDGQSLAEVIRSAGPLHPRRVAEVAFEVAGALGHAHQRGVVHRDVKPGNVLVASSGVAKVTDFGIARALSSPADDLTQAGSVMGTATYFSPEQAQGFAVDARSDLYSLGVVMFEVLCGRPPFNGDSPVAIAYKHVQERAPRPSEFVSGMPEGLEAVIMKLLSKDPANRYLSADDLRADLRRFLDGQPTLAEQAGAAPVDQPTVAVPTVATDPEATRVGVPVAAAAYAANGPATASTPVLEPEPEPEPRRTGAYAAVALLLVAALVGLGVWLFTTMGDEEADTETKPVPAVTQMTEQEAVETLRAAGFNPVVQQEPSDVAVVGVVFDQTPAAQTELAVGQDVVIKVSTGAAEAEVPTGLTGITVEEARALLEQVGLGATVEEVESDLDAGLVDSTDPAEGEKIAAKGTVTLKVSKGLGTAPIPNVAGLTLDQAKVALLKAGFIPGDVGKEQPSSTVPKGTAIGTDPTGSAEKESTVYVVISSGPDQIKVPTVKGQLEADAKAALRDKGLDQIEVEPKALPAGDPNIGRVVQVDPAAGTLVDPETTITLTVGVAAATTSTTSSTTTTTSP